MFKRTRMLSPTSGTRMKDFRGPINPFTSGIEQAYHMGTHFDAHKDALIVPALRADESIVLLPPRLAFLEPLTKAPWWLHLVTWIPFVVWQWFGRMSCACSIANVCVFWVSFAVVWPALEYGMHRWLFHMPVAWAQGNGWVNVVRFLMHTVHHAHPRDRMRLITPLPMSLAIGALVLPVPWLMLRDPDHVRAVMCGLIMGFVVYDYAHYFLHFGNPDVLPDPLNHWCHELKRAHANHHYAPGGTAQSFGVSHTIWDEWGGTYVRQRDARDVVVEKEMDKVD
jgi:sterol desaturase/sphingolipid hydroxylase (fatty acid hydroxylase superfamily)